MIKGNILVSTVRGDYKFHITDYTFNKPTELLDGISSKRCFTIDDSSVKGPVMFNMDHVICIQFIPDKN